MNSFANTPRPENVEPASPSSASLQITPTNVLSRLNLTPKESEAVCVAAGFPSATDLLDWTPSQEKVENGASAAAVYTAQKSPIELLAAVVDRITLNPCEQALVQAWYGICRRLGSFAQDVDALIQGIQSTIQRVVADSTESLDFSKIVLVLNHRLYSDKDSNTSVALRVLSDNTQFLAVSLADNPERPIFTAPLHA